MYADKPMQGKRPGDRVPPGPPGLNWTVADIFSRKFEELSF
jgi:hypothetical protein